MIMGYAPKRAVCDTRNFIGGKVAYGCVYRVRSQDAWWTNSSACAA